VAKTALSWDTLKAARESKECETPESICSAILLKEKFSEHTLTAVGVVSEVSAKDEEKGRVGLVGGIVVIEADGSRVGKSSCRQAQVHGFVRIMKAELLP